MILNCPGRVVDILEACGAFDPGSNPGRGALFSRFFRENTPDGLSSAPMKQEMPRVKQSPPSGRHPGISFQEFSHISFRRIILSGQSSGKSMVEE